MIIRLLEAFLKYAFSHQFDIPQTWDFMHPHASIESALPTPKGLYRRSLRPRLVLLSCCS